MKIHTFFKRFICDSDEKWQKNVILEKLHSHMRSHSLNPKFPWPGDNFAFIPINLLYFKKKILKIHTFFNKIHKWFWQKMPKKRDFWENCVHILSCTVWTSDSLDLETILHSSLQTVSLIKSLHKYSMVSWELIDICHYQVNIQSGGHVI